MLQWLKELWDEFKKFCRTKSAQWHRKWDLEVWRFKYRLRDKYGWPFTMWWDRRYVIKYESRKKREARRAKEAEVLKAAEEHAQKQLRERLDRKVYDQVSIKDLDLQFVNKLMVTDCPDAASSINIAKAGSTTFAESLQFWLIEMKKWQFWWWFYFIFLTVMYYKFYNKTWGYRLPFAFPKIVTSYRSHGRWGDLAICLIPIFWCANILSHSNYMLRTIEWQEDGSIIYLRVRGKQWYWVYKWDIPNYSRIEDMPVIVGRGTVPTTENHVEISRELRGRIIEKPMFKSERQDEVLTNSDTWQSRNRWINIRKSLSGVIKPLTTYTYTNAQIQRQITGSNIVSEYPYRCITRGVKGLLYAHPFKIKQFLTHVQTPDRELHDTVFENEGLMSRINHRSTIHFLRAIQLDLKMASGWVRSWDSNPLRISFISKFIYPHARRLHPTMLKTLYTPAIFEPYSMHKKLPLNRTSNYYIEGGRQLEGLIFKQLHRDSLDFLLKKSCVYLNQNRYGVRNGGLFCLATMVEWNLYSELRHHWYSPTPESEAPAQWKWAFFDIERVGVTPPMYREMIMKRQKVMYAHIWKKLASDIRNLHKNRYQQTFLYVRYFHVLNKLDELQKRPKHSMANVVIDQSLINPREQLRRYYYIKCWFKYHLVRSMHMVLLQHALEERWYISNINDVWRPGVKYSYQNKVHENFIKNAMQFTNLTDKHLQKPQTFETFVEHFKNKMQKRSEIRWIQDNFLGKNLYKLMKGKQILKLNRFDSNLETIRTAEPNMHLTVIQKRVDITKFTTKLDDRDYTPIRNSKRIQAVYWEGDDLHVEEHPTYHLSAADEFRKPPEFPAPKDSLRPYEDHYESNRRLLWLNRMLLVPSRLAITITTNSYDVVHSWFVPGLGMKLDCVPGRATHHVIRINGEGYYYGQCAEVCGRKHHHMPIKLRAMRFKFFAYWWTQTLYGSW